MIRRRALFALLVIALISPAAAENKKSENVQRNKQPFPTEICKIKAKEDLRSKCAGKRVRIKGEMKNVLPQGSDLNYPDISSMGGYTHKNRIDTQWGPLGLISRQPVTCQRTAMIEGVLRIAPLIGHNNVTYTNPYVQVLVFECN